MVDDFDFGIIRALGRNARKSFRELAKELGTSVTAVIGRVKKLEEAGIIKGYIPVVDLESLGIHLIAIISLRISKGKLLDTQKIIAEDSRVVAVYDITGEWDSIVIGYFRDRKDLNHFIKGLLAQKNVDRSSTHIVLNVVKEERRVPI